MKALLITVGIQGNEGMKAGYAIFTKVKRLSVVLAIMAFFALPAPAEVIGAPEGIALAIVYDTSGSMSETVPAGDGKRLPKYVIANKALNSIVDRISQYATNAPGVPPRKIEVGLYTFRGNTAAEAVKYGPFDPQALRNWVKNFAQPSGTTPLGNSIMVASRGVLGSSLSHKHIVIITDGMNTSGPKPEAVIPGILKAAAAGGGKISLHFVAFDVEDEEPAGVKPK